MRATILGVMGLLGCGTSEYAAECDLHPERCCDIRPSSPVCADSGDAGEVGETGCAGPTSEACGKCGTRKRACQPDGTFGAWGACEAEGECAAGTTEAVSGAACDKALEKRSRTCSATCSWGATVCAMPKGWSKMADPPAGFAGRWRAAQTWTDTEYFVWGGSNGGGDAYYSDGARWNLKTNTWKPIAKAPTELAGRVGASAVATGVDVIVWGGQTISGSPATRNTGARYVAVRDEWVSMAVSPLKPRHSHAAAWTGSKMIVWGGHSGVASDMLADGAIYDPGTDAWSTLPAAPIDGRSAPAATWTGEEFIVFGGTIGEITGARDGAAFNPTTGLWRKIEPYSGPIRDLPGVTVGPKSVFVFGGFTLSGSLELQNDGAWWDQASGWAPVTALDGALLSPPARVLPAAWCRGDRCWTWSGCNDGKTGKLDKLAPAASGAVFERTSGKWSPMSKDNEPAARAVGSVIDTKDFVVVWGGWDCAAAALGTGGVFVP